MAAQQSEAGDALAANRQEVLREWEPAIPTSITQLRNLCADWGLKEATWRCGPDAEPKLMACEGDCEPALALLQFQLEVNVSNASSSALFGSGMEMTALLQSWSASAALKMAYIRIPTWLVVLILVVLAVSSFYLVNFFIWRERRKTAQQRILETAKAHEAEGNMLGRLVEAAIEHFDQQLFGLAVNFGAVKVSAAEGSVTIHDLVIENPPGYWSDCFLRVGYVLVDIDLAAFISSLGKHVVIERLELQDVEVFWERAFLESTNLQKILSLLHHGTHKEDEAPEAHEAHKERLARRPQFGRSQSRM
ncbi:unnamed protein product [Effrenium voratum]|nr:unnamed protein product [Effrenium voratum]